MNCIVTAGPSYEPLDEVRRLINFSTGRLGSELAGYLAGHGHRVTLLLGQQATWRGQAPGLEVIPFTTTADLGARLESLASQPVDAVFHAAAVSDFAFGTIWRGVPGGELEIVQAGKISSGDGPLVAELVPTLKIISNLRVWFRSACLVGWKYEVEGNQSGVVAKAEQQIAGNSTNACVANGPAYGRGFGLVTGLSQLAHLEEEASLFAALEELIQRAKRRTT